MNNFDLLESTVLATSGKQVISAKLCVYHKKVHLQSKILSTMCTKYPLSALR